VLGAALVLAAAPGLSPAAPFTFSSERLAPALRHEMRGVSWHEGCPVGLDGLRRLRIAHWGFDGRRRIGEMVVAATVVRRVRTAFATLYRRHFPIRRMHLVDRYGASDYASIEADNTSAFNCRRVTGGRAWSEHAYGRAIDVNPIENPYVYADGTTTHRASRPYLDRSPYRPGMAVRGGVLVGAFRGAGWSWGGDWSPPKDLQHFSTTGR
jgi:hypothetical protein